MMNAFENAHPQEHEAPSARAAARLKEIDGQRTSLGRLKKGGDAASFIDQLRSLKTQYQALGREITTDIKAETDQKELTSLRKLQEKARRQADRLSDRMKKMAAKHGPTTTPTTNIPVATVEEFEDDNKENSSEADAGDPWIAQPVHTYLEPGGGKVATSETDAKVEDVEDDDENSPEAEAWLDEHNEEQTRAKQGRDRGAELAEETEPEIITEKEQAWLEGDDNAFKIKLADRTARRPEQRVTINPAEQKESLQESLQSLRRQQKSLRAERDALEEISVGQRSRQQKTQLDSVRESLKTITASIEQTTSELATISQRIENDLMEARAAEREAQEAAELEEKRALARRLVAEQRRKLSVASFVEQSHRSANENLQQATEQADAIAGLRSEISGKESTIEDIEGALSIVEEKLATAKNDRKLLESQEGSTLNTKNLRALDEDISRYEQDIAYKEEAIHDLDNQIIKIRLEIKKRLSAEERAEDEVRFAPNPDADKRDKVTSLQREQAELAKSRERLAAAQAEAKIIAARVRADAELAARVNLAPSAAELRTAEISRRIKGTESRKVAALEREVAFEAEVKKRVSDAAASFDQPARLDAQMAELTAKEADILKQIEDLEAGISPDTSQELSSVQAYLELDNAGLNTVYTFMKIMEEDSRIIGILPTDIANVINGRTWKEIAKELQGASQKTGIFSRMWRSAFGDPNTKLKEALQIISGLNPAELRRAANIPVQAETPEHRRRRTAGGPNRGSSSLSQTSVSPFGGVSRW